MNRDCRWSPAIKERNYGPRHSHQLGSQEILSEVIQLLLRESISGQAQLQDGYARSAIVDDKGRQSAWRELAKRSLGYGRHLRIRGVQTRAVLQVNPDDGLTIYSSRFDVFHVVNRGVQDTVIPARQPAF